MNNTIGNMNEDYMVKNIDGKTFSELNENLQHFLCIVFPDIKDSDKLRAYKTENYIKPDMVVECNGIRKFISVKYGNSETVQTESLLTFLDFLRKNGIDEYSIESYLLFHYGDGTTDGTGRFRLSSVETRFKMHDRLKKLNEALNQDKDFVLAFVNRMMWDGVNPQADKAEFLYHGDPEYGVFMNKNQMTKHLSVKNWDFMDSCVHVGPLVIRPKYRYSNKEIANEEMRHYVTITYPRLVSDILYISSRNDY